uniref:Uncharacterized protein n=1 Tax=Timema monikensis TaxID=170555 RepID=A0A7R9E9L7_9NEOP|nr:unnamed protein product [Timema monikensis]
MPLQDNLQGSSLTIFRHNPPALPGTCWIWILFFNILLFNDVICSTTLLLTDVCSAILFSLIVEESLRVYDNLRRKAKDKHNLETTSNLEMGREMGEKTDRSESRQHEVAVGGKDLSRQHGVAVGGRMNSPGNTESRWEAG